MKEYEAIIKRILELKETVINKGAVLEIGRLLNKVKDEKMYGGEFEFFDEFLHKKVGFNRTDAEKLIAISQSRLPDFNKDFLSFRIEFSEVEQSAEKVYSPSESVELEEKADAQVVLRPSKVNYVNKSVNFFEETLFLAQKLYDELSLAQDLKAELDSHFFKINTKLSSDFNGWSGKKKLLAMMVEIKRKL